MTVPSGSIIHNALSNHASISEYASSPTFRKPDPTASSSAFTEAIRSISPTSVESIAYAFISSSSASNTLSNCHRFCPSIRCVPYESSPRSSILLNVPIDA